MLIGCEIKLDVGNVFTARGNGTAIGDLAPTGWIAAGIIVDIKILQVSGKLNAGLLVDPLGDGGKGLAQKGCVQMGGVCERKIEIF